MQLLTAWVGPISSPNTTLILTSVTPTANQVLRSTSIDLGGTRRIYVTFTIGEPTTSFLIITGRGWGGAGISEAIYAPATGTVSISTKDFYQVDKVQAGNVAFVGSVTAGTGVRASSRWLRFDDFMPIEAFGQVNAFGTVNYTVETTMDDPTQEAPPGLPHYHEPIWFSSMSSNVVAATTSQQFLFHVPSFLRITLNSSGNTSGDYVEGKFTQHSSVPGIFQ